MIAATRPVRSSIRHMSEESHILHFNGLFRRAAEFRAGIESPGTGLLRINSIIPEQALFG
jgi:hypothetical protein